MQGKVAGLVLCGLLAGCTALGPLAPFFGERAILSVEATGAKVIPRTVIREIPIPTGGFLAQVLFESYAATFIEQATELDDCKVATTHEPADPDQLGDIIVSATLICRLGPQKVKVREVVTFTLSPVPVPPA